MIFEGDFSSPAGRFAIVAARFNSFIVDQLLAGAIDALNPGVELVGPAADTYWVNDYALQAVSGWLTTDPNIKGYMYEYADGMDTALKAYDDLGLPVKNLTMALRTDEQTLFCDWVARDGAANNVHIYYSAGGNFQSRVAVTAAMQIGRAHV